MNRFAIILKPLAKGIAALSPSCKQASRLQSEALDHRLPILQRVGFRIHLYLCKWCRRYGKQLGFLRNAARYSSDQFVESSPQKLPAAARERMKQRLRAEKE